MKRTGLVSRHWPRASWLLRTGDESPAWDKQEAGNPVRYIISLNVLNQESKGWHQPRQRSFNPY